MKSLDLFHQLGSMSGYLIRKILMKTHSSLAHRGTARAEKLLGEFGFPCSDQLALYPSPYSFPDNKKFGIEIPVINSLSILEKTTALLKEQGITSVRFNETRGAFLLPTSEIKEMLALCAESQHGILFSISARPEYDRKASFYRTEFGLEQGRKINNNNAIAYAIEEVLKLADLGCKGVLVYDLGILKILNQLKISHLLPADFILKASTHCMVTNPMTAVVYAENGIDSITTPHDLDLVMLQEMRRLLKDKVVLDVPMDTYKAKGGFIRFFEAGEIVEVASPVMLKVGASAQGHPYDPVNAHIIEERIKRVAIVLEKLDQVNLLHTKLDHTSSYMAIPQSHGNIHSLMQEA